MMHTLKEKYNMPHKISFVYGTARGEKIKTLHFFFVGVEDWGGGGLEVESWKL